MKSSVLVKTGGIYLGLSVVSNLINLFLTPIYTNNLTITEYGSYSIITSYQSLFSIFITLGIFSGMKRFFNEYEDKNRLKNIALTFSLFWGALVFVLGMIFAQGLAGIIFPSEVQGTEYLRYVVINSILSCIISIYTAYYSMQYKAMKASFIELSKLILTLVFTLIFVVAYDEGIIGILKSQCFSYAIVPVILIIVDIKRIRFELGKDELKEMLTYGVGIVGASDILDWVLTLIDRYFLKIILGYATVAVYSIGYKVGMLIMPFFIVPFRNMLTPYKYSIYMEDDGKKKLEELFDYYCIIGWFIVLGISIYANLAIQVLATDEYAQAFKIVPIIVIAYLLEGSCEFFSLGIHIEKKVALNLAVPGVAAAMNMALNLVLIPQIGSYGAAIATIISYFAMALMYHYAGRIYYRMDINVLRLLRAGIPFVTIYGIYMYCGIYGLGPLEESALNLLLCVAYLAISVTFGFIPKSRMAILAGFVRARLAKRRADDEGKDL